MKKKFGLLLAGCLALGVICHPSETVQATNFAGKEDEYTEKCKNTTSLSRSDLNVCSEFSDYLKEKNESIKSSIADTQGQLDTTMSDLAAVQTQLETTNQQIASVQNELEVLQGSIAQLNTDIQDKETKLADRLYIMQSYVNGGQLINVILSAGSFDELLNRMQSVEELTSYDKELITGLANDKKELEEKEVAVQESYDSLFVLQTQQTELENALSEQADSYQSTLDEQTAVMNNYNVEIGAIDESLTENEKRILAEEERQKEEERLKQEQEQQASSSNNGSSSSGGSGSSSSGNGGSSSSGGSGSSGGSSSSSGGSSSSSTPNYSGHSGIVQAALSKNGCRYVYGGTGPNVFDCSGLAQWSYRQAGIAIPRTVTLQYYACTLVSSPQPGDLVFFNTTGHLTHVGIYIGNNQFIHAGSSSTGVYIASLSNSYWASRIEGYGHFD